MRTVKDILIVVLLAAIAFLAIAHDADITDLKYRTQMAKGGLMFLHRRLVQLEDGLAATQDGLASLKDESNLHRLWTATAQINVREQTSNGPITFFRMIRGTGVFVSNNVLLTAKHVVENRVGLSDVKVLTDTGLFTVMEILEDADDDLAVIIIAGRTGPHLKLGPWPSLGDKVICVGSPVVRPQQLIMSWGRVSSEKWNNMFLIDGFVAPGCSGGPVIVEGRLAGITSARLINPMIHPLGYAVPIERLDPSLIARIR